MAEEVDPADIVDEADEVSRRSRPGPGGHTCLVRSRQCPRPATGTPTEASNIESRRGGIMARKGGNRGSRGGVNNGRAFPVIGAKKREPGRIYARHGGR